MSPFDVEDQIQQALEAGRFDRLRGQGKPFTHLDTDPLKQLVQEQGVVPNWLEIDHKIRAKIEIARQSIRRTYEWVMQTWGSGGSDRAYARDEWHTARHIFAQRLDEINKLIRAFNLELPEPLRHLQRFPLKIDEELTRLGLTEAF
ncbi:MAG TPA: DnaJ family domain-containing protein [Anaerolineae bacterium]|nr:DnaJ family domain-containing protein [Anaerolineae bacterium]